MITTIIGFNLGLHEINYILSALLDRSPLLLLLYPILVLGICYLFYKVFNRWRLELKVGLIFLCFSYFLAGAMNITNMVI